MALWWHQPLRQAAQTDNSALLVCLSASYCQIGKFIWTRMKTLATLSANGFEAVFEVVSVIMVDQLSRVFFFFFFSVSPDGNYKQWGFYRHCHVCESGRDGTVFVDAMQLNKMKTWKILTLLIAMNSRNVPVSRTRLISTCTEEIHGTVKGMSKNIGPIQCVNMACVY